MQCFVENLWNFTSISAIYKSIEKFEFLELGPTFSLRTYFIHIKSQNVD